MIYAKIESGEWSDVLRWSQTVIDLANDDPSKGNLLFGSPLGGRLSSRGLARWCLGRPGWRDDMRRRRGDGPQRRPLVARRGRRLRIRPGDTAWRAAVRRFARCARSRTFWGLPNDPGMISRWPTRKSRWALRWCTATRLRSVTAEQRLLAEVGEVFVRREHNLADLPIVEVYLARERLGVANATRRYRSCAVPSNDLFREGRLLLWNVAATGVLVETLLDRGAEHDVVEAQAAIERLAAAPADDGSAIRDIWLLRLRALSGAGSRRRRGLRTTSGIVTAKWRNRLASKDTSTGRRR